MVMKNLVVVVGKAGAGKDSLADFLVANHGFAKVSFADPLKRVCRDIYGFSIQQLWGPSVNRNAPDFRYPRTGFARAAVAKVKDRGLELTAANVAPLMRVRVDEHWFDGLRPDSELLPEHFLTPRYALQKLGTEWGRDCYDATWVEYMFRVADQLLDPKRGFEESGLNRALSPFRARYVPWEGVLYSVEFPEVKGVVVPDGRFANEALAVTDVGGIACRIKRPTAGLEGAAAEHRSETEQDRIPDELFATQYMNDGTLQSLANYAGVLSDVMRLRS